MARYICYGADRHRYAFWTFRFDRADLSRLGHHLAGGVGIWHRHRLHHHGLDPFRRHHPVDGHRQYHRRFADGRKSPRARRRQKSHPLDADRCDCCQFGAFAHRRAHRRSTDPFLAGAGKWSFQGKSLADHTRYADWLGLGFFCPLRHRHPDDRALGFCGVAPSQPPPNSKCMEFRGGVKLVLVK